MSAYSSDDDSSFRMYAYSSDDDSDGLHDPEQDCSDDEGGALVEVIKSGLLDEANIDLMEIINEPRGTRGYTALQAASLTGQIEAVRFLLEKGADIHKKGEPPANFAPIHLACFRRGHPAVLELLLSHGANIEDRDTVFGRTPLSYAVLYNRIEIVRILLAHGANPQNNDFPANYPLHEACTGGKYEVVKILLDHGANLRDWDATGNTPLHSSCRGRKAVLMVTLLLESGADPNHPDRDGHYVLNDDHVRRCFFGRLPPLLERLLDYGAGAGLPCRLEDEANHSKCNTTVLMCCFQTLRREAMQNRLFSTLWNYEDVRDTFEGHFIRINAAGLNSSQDETPFEPPEKYFDWSESSRGAYRVQCEEELRRLKTEMIADTSATYFSLLSRDLPVLLGQDKWPKLTRESSVRQFPIYGNMLHCSYLRTLRPILETLSSEFFSILSPSLIPDCAELVMSYLSNRDLESLVALCEAYQAFMQRRSSEVPT